MLDQSGASVQIVAMFGIRRWLHNELPQFPGDVLLCGRTERNGPLRPWTLPVLPCLQVSVFRIMAAAAGRMHEEERW